MRRFFQLLFKLIFRDAGPPVSLLGPIRRRQAELALLGDGELRAVGRSLLSGKGKSATRGSRADRGRPPYLVLARFLDAWFGNWILAVGAGG